MDEFPVRATAMLEESKELVAIPSAPRRYFFPRMGSDDPRGQGAAELESHDACLLGLYPCMPRNSFL